jgi:transcriptional regulator with XRE-family HTH domain
LLDGGQARLQAFRGKDLQANPCRAGQLFEVELLEELVEKLSTTQSATTQLESSTYTPSVSTLKKAAEATHSRLRIEFIPSEPGASPA